MSGSHNTFKFDLEGHRGCRGLLPENTIPAMLRAMDFGVTTLEMDVVITADSQVVLSHEPFFNHEITTLPTGEFVTEQNEKQFNIYQMRMVDLRKFDVGLKPHPRFPDQQKIPVHKPMLREVFEAVKQYCKQLGRPIPDFNIETKCMPETDDLFHPKPDQFATLLVQELQAAQVTEHCIIQSFDFRTLQYLHRQHPTIRLSALVEDGFENNIDLIINRLGFIPTVFSPMYQLLTPKIIDDCHERGIRVIPWTINDQAVAERLKAWKVDGLITDYPDRIN